MTDLGAFVISFLFWIMTIHHECYYDCEAHLVMSQVPDFYCDNVDLHKVYEILCDKGSFVEAQTSPI